MALPDPIPTLTVDSVTYDFARTGSGEGRSTYATADALNRLTIAHSQNKRNRTLIRLDRDFVAADPYVPAQNQKFSHSVWTVFESPVVGVTPAQRDKLGQLHRAILLEGTPDYVLRMLQGES